MSIHWMREAACNNHPVVPSEAWLEKPSTHGAWNKDAIEVCTTECPVRNQCLEFALSAETYNYARWGIYGGLTPRQRTQMQVRSIA